MFRIFYIRRWNVLLLAILILLQQSLQLDTIVGKNGTSGKAGRSAIPALGPRSSHSFDF
jgi:hypothetical protein